MEGVFSYMYNGLKKVVPNTSSCNIMLTQKRPITMQGLSAN